MGSRRYRFGRRQFLGNSIAAMAGTAAFVGVGCGGDDDEDTVPSDGAGNESNTGAGTATETPKRGGIMRNHMTGDPTGFDTRQTTAEPTNLAFSQMFNGLVQYQPLQYDDGPSNIEADLAERWETPDPTTLVFTLHKGVTFHDGAPFTARDVVASFDWIRNPPQGKASVRKTALAAISKVEATDEHTVTITLTRPNPSLLSSLALHAYGMTSERSAAEIGDPANGTGPFKYKSYEKSNFFETVRNDTYFKQGLPYLDGIKNFIQSDLASAKANFIAGQYDTYWPGGRGPEDLESIEQALGNKVILTSKVAPNHRALAFGTSKSPFNDVKVRQAINMALDRYEIIEFATQGVGSVGAYLKPGGAWAIPENELVAVPGYGKAQIDDAKKLLSAAGVADGTQITLTSIAAYQSQVELMQSQLKKIGLDVTLDIVDSAASTSKLSSGNFDIALHGVGGLDDPDDIFGQRVLDGGATNFSKVKDSRIGPLYEKQSQTLEYADRKRLSQELEKLLLELYAGTAYVYAVTCFAVHSNVKNVVLHPNQTAGGRKHDIAWIA